MECLGENIDLHEEYTKLLKDWKEMKDTLETMKDEYKRIEEERDAIIEYCQIEKGDKNDKNDENDWIECLSKMSILKQLCIKNNECMLECMVQNMNCNGKSGEMKKALAWNTGKVLELQNRVDELHKKRLKLLRHVANCEISQATYNKTLNKHQRDVESFDAAMKESNDLSIERNSLTNKFSNTRKDWDKLNNKLSIKYVNVWKNEEKKWWEWNVNKLSHWIVFKAFGTPVEKNKFKCQNKNKSKSGKKSEETRNTIELDLEKHLQLVLSVERKLIDVHKFKIHNLSQKIDNICLMSLLQFDFDDNNNDGNENGIGGLEFGSALRVLNSVVASINKMCSENVIPKKVYEEMLRLEKEEKEKEKEKKEKEKNSNDNGDNGDSKDDRNDLSGSEESDSDSDIDSELLCPITNEMMRVPVISMDCEIYDLSNLTTYITEHGKTPLGVVVPNIEVYLGGCVVDENLQNKINKIIGQDEEKGQEKGQEKQGKQGGKKEGKSGKMEIDDQEDDDDDEDEDEDSEDDDDVKTQIVSNGNENSDENENENENENKDNETKENEKKNETEKTKEKGKHKDKQKEQKKKKEKKKEKEKQKKGEDENENESENDNDDGNDKDNGEAEGEVEAEIEVSPSVVNNEDDNSKEESENDNEDDDNDENKANDMRIEDTIVDGVDASNDDGNDNENENDNTSLVDDEDTEDFDILPTEMNNDNVNGNASHISDVDPVNGSPPRKRRKLNGGGSKRT